MNKFSPRGPSRNPSVPQTPPTVSTVASTRDILQMQWFPVSATKTNGSPRESVYPTNWEGSTEGTNFKLCSSM